MMAPKPVHAKKTPLGAPNAKRSSFNCFGYILYFVLKGQE